MCADELFGESSIAGRSAKKTSQLCSQVQRALSWALDAELQDPLLSELRLMEVQPYPDGSHLLVVFAAPSGSNLGEAEERLRRATALFREEIARELTRKRLPLLSFIVLPEQVHHE